MRLGFRIGSEIKCTVASVPDGGTRSSDDGWRLRSGDEMTLYLRYRADIWVEVDTEEEDVVSVLVDDLTMATPVTVVDGDGGDAGWVSSIRARHIADTCCWPSWDYGSHPCRSRAKPVQVRACPVPRRCRCRWLAGRTRS